MKRTATGVYCFALSTVIAAGLAMRAPGAAITLKANDLAGESSFVTNMTDSVHGWNDGLAPHADAEYEVSNKELRTPASGDAVWGGGKLTISNGGKVFTPTTAPNKVDLGEDVEIRNGVIGATSGWSVWYPDLYGTLTVTCTTLEGARFGLYIGGAVSASNYMTIKGAANACIGWYPNATLKTYTGGESSTSRNNYFKGNYCTATPYFRGDASEFYGTNVIRSLVKMTLASTHEFGGTLFFYPASKVTFDDSISSYAFRGDIAGTDGLLDIPEGVTLSARALDFAFADRDSVVAEFKYMKDGVLTTVNEYVYTSAPATDDYVPSNRLYVSKSYRYVNTIALGAGATFFADSAKLNGTLVQMGQGAAINLNSLVADGVTIESAGSMVTVSNSLDIVSPIKLEVTTGGTQPIFRCPTAAKKLEPGDFTSVDGVVAGSCRIKVQIETDSEGMQTVWVTNDCPPVFDETSGYAVLKFSESSSGPQNPLVVPGGGYFRDRKAFSATTLELTESKGLTPSWSDGSAPNPSTNYYVNNWMGTCTETFAGKSLTFGPKAFFRYYDNNVFVPDWRALGGCTLICDINQTAASLTFGGSVRLFSTIDNPVKIEGGKVYKAMLDLIGDTNSALLLQEYSGNFKNPLTVHFLGDNSRFYGTFLLRSSSTALLKNSASNATVELVGANSAVGVAEQATAPVKVAKIRFRDGPGVTVDAGQELAAGVLDIVGNGENKTLVKSGEGLFAVGGNAKTVPGAALSVTAGGLRLESATALKGMALAMAADTALSVTYDPEDAALMADGPAVASFTAAGTVAVGVDFGSREPPASGTIKLITMPAADAAALDGKLVAARVGVNGYGAKLVKGAPVDGKVTYSLHVSWCGLRIILR
ncbi:MAG: hypothetical protein MJ240_13630 [Kiritimatiellae bacterium]|nr:hypothetical protein [Kiritimatiellia bacterium]